MHLADVGDACKGQARCIPFLCLHSLGQRSFAAAKLRCNGSCDLLSGLQCRIRGLLPTT